ncbi:hypothetical protein [Hymenobacter sp. UYCo722]|uniref:hypothetical protein n=1 Tax=Hymenobacter sp. UYCo722 TaxID=3156335 RepID=UPI00339812D9
MKLLLLWLLPLLGYLPAAVGRLPLPAAFAVDEAGTLTPFIEAPAMDAAAMNGLMEQVRERLR